MSFWFLMMAAALSLLALFSMALLADAFTCKTLTVVKWNL